ncbi:MAG: LysR substrate-binding domain-containing protein [Hyphomicrobiales bacterium]
MNTIHLNGLRAIEAVGRLGSLTAAAEELGVTLGAVSQQVQKGEKQLGRKLFERRPKGLELTALGTGAMPHLTAGMRELSIAVSQLTEHRDDPLTVSVPPVFAAKWLVWRIKDFNAAHPTIRIRMDATMDQIDMTRSDVDVCIRVCQNERAGHWPGVKSTKLFDQLVFPVCSPRTAEHLSKPRDLLSFPTVRDQRAVFDWDIWFQPGEPKDADLQNGPTFSDASLCLDSTVAGQGVFLGWETLACDALEAGRVVEPFDRRVQTDFSYWLLQRPHSRKATSIGYFTSWLMTELSQSLGRTIPQISP